jgi:hypothetical protein
MEIELVIVGLCACGICIVAFVWANMYYTVKKRENERGA